MSETPSSISIHSHTSDVVRAESRALFEEVARTGRLVAQADAEGRLATERSLSTLRADVAKQEQQTCAKITILEAALALEVGKIRELIVAEADRTRTLISGVDTKRLERELGVAQAEVMFLRGRLAGPAIKIES